MDLEAWAWSVHYDALERIAPLYEEQSANTVQTSEASDDKTTQKLISSLQAQSSLPSISLVLPGSFKSVARKGGFQRIDDLVKKNEDQLFTVAKTKFKVNGKYFGFPNDLGPYAYFYNTELFEEAGLPTEPEAVEQEIQTWDQFIEAGKQLEQATGAKMISFEDTDYSNGLARAMPLQAGGIFYNEDGEFQFNMPSNVTAFKKLQELHREINTPTQQWSNKYYSQHSNGEVAVAPGAAWLVGIMKQNMTGLEGKVRIARIPRIGELDSARGANYGGGVAGIPTPLGQKETEQAKDFGTFWHVSETGFNQKLKAGAFPANKVEGAEMMEKEDPFFGGQKRTKKFVQSAEECPPQYPDPVLRGADIVNTYQSFVTDILRNDKDVKTAIDATHEKMMNNIQEADKTVDK
ncbi:extracellular solute-binding protein [Haloferax gibbonsii]|uniref:Sugar ABC transporter substrate-binding protein n=1 Tax=Haloferax gibbonsii TaxID=35746 RepID=A0A0K1IZG5_HALGI|nr:extracellular solute-binding protein [Haloferax gibbonsii]AKU09834.1 hypothetical protein ABY42_18620 [Haloferax gibbonsii]